MLTCDRADRSPTDLSDLAFSKVDVELRGASLMDNP
ncbi:hypothetical protein SM11_pD1454 (plasmid) [Sinorhizobium meliloti SM11]|uniref:Uncharacterized protein n=1 Tax=Sinorhizobium meliloti (strain SM11) TaxID=707241 RepID=F7XIY4_SINMM|nr:hypothetical protein SM11_pD1454 [Sinorhizobium meliloti SM11]